MTEISQCQNRDIPELFEIFKSVYSSNLRMRERDYFEWQFKNTPFSENKEEYSFLILRANGNIRGFLGYVPNQFRANGEIRTGCWTYNLVSLDRDGSGLTLFSRLMEIHDNIFILGYSSDSEPIFRKYQMPMNNIPRWAAFIDPEKAADLFGIKDKSLEIKLRKSHDQFMRSGGCSEGIDICGRFDPEEEFLLDNWKSVKSYIRRTGRYLNWRYMDIPRHDYRAIRAEDQQFAVYRIETVKDRTESVVRILEWNFSKEWSKRAIAFIIQEAKKSGSIMIDFFCTASDIGKELERHGFLNEKDFSGKIPFLFRPVHYKEGIGVAIDVPPHRQERNLNFSEWYITKGDSDVDRIKL